MNRLLGSLTAALTVLALAGCATASDPGAATPSRAAAVRPASTVSATTAPNESDRNPERLRGLSPEAVTGLIGMPHYTRREGSATVWQYYAGGCVMDLFWYATSDGPRLYDYEVRGVRLTGTAEARSCFGDLLVRRADSATS